MTEGNPRKAQQIQGEPGLRSLAPPIYPATVYCCDSPQQASDLLAGEIDGFVYSRDGHPNSDMLAARCAELHHADHAAITGSGMAALALAITAHLKQGDHVVVSHQLYGRSLALFTSEIERMGIGSTQVDTNNLDAVQSAVTSATRFLITETISNPMLHVADLRALAKIAHDRNTLLLVDNTLASPVLCRPLTLGADLVVESITKIMNGHSDVILGCLCGMRSSWERVTLAATTWGLFASPIECWLGMRGMATLSLRMERASATALALAEQLTGHRAITAVHYPGLTEGTDHQLATRQLATGIGNPGYGNMLTIELAGGYDAAERFIRSVTPEIPFCPSLGELTTTLSHPETTSHREMNPEQLRAVGITGGTIRLSIGIESADSILAALERGLQTKA